MIFISIILIFFFRVGFLAITPLLIFNSKHEKFKRILIDYILFKWECILSNTTIIFYSTINPTPNLCFCNFRWFTILFNLESSHQSPCPINILHLQFPKTFYKLSKSKIRTSTWLLLSTKSFSCSYTILGVSAGCPAPVIAFCARLEHHPPRPGGNSSASDSIYQILRLRMIR